MTESNRRWIFYESLSKTQSNPVTTEEAQLAILKMSERDTERFLIWTAGWESWQPLRAYLSSNQKNFFSSLKVAIENNVPEETITAYQTLTREEREVLEMKPADEEVEEEITKSAFNASLTNNTKTNAYSKISLTEEGFDLKEEHNQFGTRFDAEELNVDQNHKPKINFKSLSAKSLKDRYDRHELKIEVLFVSKNGGIFRSWSQNISLSGSLIEDNIPFEYTSRMFDVVVIDNQQTDPKLQRVALKAKTIGQGVTRRIHFLNVTPTVKRSLQSLLENYLKSQEKLKKKTA